MQPTHSAHHALAPLLLAIALPAAGLQVIRHQIDIDINQKALAWNPVHFDMMELLDMEKWLTTHPDGQPVHNEDNLMLTHDQRIRLAIYVNVQLKKALLLENTVRSGALQLLLDRLLDKTTLVTPFRVFICHVRVFGLFRALPALWTAIFSAGTGRTTDDESAQSHRKEMSVQEIMDTGELSELALAVMPSGLLRELDAKLTEQIGLLKEANWGPLGTQTVRKYEALQAQLQQVLNKTFGVDGMTPIAH